MSMYRQLLLAIILSTLLAILGGLFASTVNTRTYLIEQLNTKNIDNATVLALSLSQKNVDPVELELVVTSLFDNGYYSSIKVTDPKGKILVERKANSQTYEVPKWFMSLFPINPHAGQAQITNGWNLVGTISVASHIGNSYLVLWNSVLQMLMALTLSGFISTYLSSLILRRLKKPLKQVIEQAKGMSERVFITTNVSTVPELKQLSLAMNSTVGLLKSMFADEAERIESLRKQTNTDGVTGLANRSHFLSQLDVTIGEENAPPGSLIMIRIAGLTEANRVLGRNNIDSILRKIGDILRIKQDQLLDGFAARLNGTDFALLFRQITPEPIAQHLLDEITKELSEIAGATMIYIGYGEYSFGISHGALLSQVDAAVANAEACGINNSKKAIPLDIEQAPRSAEEWSKLILRALEQKWVKLAFFPVTNLNGDIIHRESALRLMFGGEWFPAGRFLPIAERLGLTHKLDLTAVKLALNELQRTGSISDIAVNLSVQSIQNPEFREELRNLLNAKPLASKHLWLEISENGVFSNMDAFRTFHAEMKKFGCQFGLEHFGRKFDQINILHDLGLNYVKIDSVFVRNIDFNDGNQAFIKGVSSIARHMGLKAITEGVNSDAELNTMKNLGVDGVTGPAVSRAFQIKET
jgi:EAL domain-containing protein (putative c-di-GMP-specific phosphodiesterase class I)/GGDEF domain-containing protein